MPNHSDTAAARGEGGGNFTLHIIDVNTQRLKCNPVGGRPATTSSRLYNVLSAAAQGQSATGLSRRLVVVCSVIQANSDCFENGTVVVMGQ